MKEIQKRRLIRRHLTDWVRFCGFEPARHHRLLLEALEELTSGGIERLAVFMPPGAAKSTYASILYPCWYLAQHPDHSIIAASHTAELASKWGRRVRNLIAEHQLVLNYGLAPDSQAADRWETDKQGEYYASGVGGAITGRRADLALIDDPVASREAAESALTRDKTWEWYKSDLLTRLKPGGRIVLIQTRWHEDDLAGRILNDAAHGGRPWHVISLPMEAEDGDPLGRSPGEALWPEWFTDAMRTEAKRDTRTWTALYQQRPVPEEGAYFKAEWFRPIDILPKKDSLRIYGGSDYAVTADGGDYTVHAIVGVDPDERIYLLDLWRKQAASDEWVDAWCDLVIKWKPMEWAEEQGQIRSGIGPFLERESRQRRAFCVRSQFPTRGEKAVRAQSIRAMMASDGLYLPTSAPWRAEFEAELLRFPAGVHDDQVDAIGLVGQLLDRMLGKRKPEKPKPEKSSGYKYLGSQSQPSWRI